MEEKIWRKRYKIAGGVVGAIFLGAIGNGFWEWFLRDALSSMFSALANFAGSISSSYLDRIHADIGKADNGALLAIPLFVLVSLVLVTSIGGTLFMFRIRTKYRAAGLPEPDFAQAHRVLRFFSGRGVWLFVAMAAFNVASYSEQLFSTMYELRASTWAQRSIEILRPKAGEKKYVQLRAEFRAVKDAKSFYYLFDDLKRESARVATDLPDFDPVGH